MTEVKIPKEMEKAIEVAANDAYNDIITAGDQALDELQYTFDEASYELQQAIEKAQAELDDIISAIVQKHIDKLKAVKLN